MDKDQYIFNYNPPHYNHDDKHTDQAGEMEREEGGRGWRGGRSREEKRR